MTLLVATCVFAGGALDVQRAADELKSAGFVVSQLSKKFQGPAPYDGDLLEATCNPGDGLGTIDRIRQRFNSDDTRDKKVFAIWERLNDIVEPHAGYCATIGEISCRDYYEPFGNYFTNHRHLYTTGWLYDETGTVMRGVFLWAPERMSIGGFTEDRLGRRWVASSRIGSDE